MVNNVFYVKRFEQTYIFIIQIENELIITTEIMFQILIFFILKPYDFTLIIHSCL